MKRSHEDRRKAREQEEEKERIEDAIWDMLPSEVEPRIVYGFGYKCKGGVGFTGTMDGVAGLMEYLPPMELHYLTGYYKSFFPAGTPLSEREAREYKTDEIIAPFLLKVGQYDHEVNWYTVLQGWVISVKYEVTDLWKYCHITTKWKDYMGGRYCEYTGFEAPGLQKWGNIKWASGGNEYPNSFTVYWYADVKWQDIFNGKV